jgi:hypothetical protein
MVTLFFTLLSLGTYAYIFFCALKDMIGLLHDERSEQIR